MEEYIKKETAYRAIMGERPEAREPSWFAELVLEIPAADVAPVRHGRWLCVDTDTERFFLCNRCKEKEYGERNYCPNCGANMRGINYE